MSNLSVRLFAADPLSIHGREPRLQLDKEVEKIETEVLLATHRDRVDFKSCWATSIEQMGRELNRARPQVVHFSGHGGRAGLVLVDEETGEPRRVGAAALESFFHAHRDRIKLVILNACHSRPEAEAIARAVGCAIGVPNPISDTAAIKFSAAFYSAITFGRSVQTAFDQACATLEANDFLEGEWPVLETRGVNPAQLVLIRPELEPAPADPPPPPLRKRGPARTTRSALVAATVLAFAGGAYVVHDSLAGEKVPPLRTDVPSAMAPEAAFDSALQLLRAGNDSAALPYLQHAAEGKVEEAMAYLGMAYLEGKGTERQPVLGAQWLRDAAEAGNARGMNGRALAYQRGEGETRSRRWARHWFAKAASLGFVDAMRNLGLLYREEFLADSGYAPVLYWLGMAADSGSRDALVDLGAMHEAGEGVPRDTAEALRLYTRAANEGSTRAMVALGHFYQQRGNYVLALDWYRKGAEREDPEAINNLGVMYQNGWGVEVDLDEARRLYGRAAAAGSTVAGANLRALADG